MRQDSIRAAPKYLMKIDGKLTSEVHARVKLKLSCAVYGERVSSATYGMLCANILHKFMMHLPLTAKFLIT